MSERDKAIETQEAVKPRLTSVYQVVGFLKSCIASGETLSSRDLADIDEALAYHAKQNAEAEKFQMSELPVAVCRDSDLDGKAEGCWLVLYKNQADAMADKDRAFILEFESARNIQQWLAFNLQMMNRIVAGLDKQAEGGEE